MFSEDIKRAVWAKAQIVEGYDPNSIRKDPCGAFIIWNQYGNRASDFGWEIDHVYPVALGGGDELENLRAMHWENNNAKGNDYPSYNAAVTAKDNKNIHIEQSYSINSELQSKLRLLYGLK